MCVAGPMFKLHHSNFVKIHISEIWKNGQFLSFTLQILQDLISLFVVKLSKFLSRYLKWFQTLQKSEWVFHPYLDKSLSYHTSIYVLDATLMQLQLEKVSWLPKYLKYWCGSCITNPTTKYLVPSTLTRTAEWACG